MSKPPERIYLQVDPEGYNQEINTTWCQDRINDDDVEYVRADLLCDADCEKCEEYKFPVRHDDSEKVPDADCEMCEQYRFNEANYCPHCLKKFNRTD